MGFRYIHAGKIEKYFFSFQLQSRMGMLLLPETKLDSEKLLEPQMLETNQKINNFNQGPVSGSIQVHLSLQVSVPKVIFLQAAEFSCS